MDERNPLTLESAISAMYIGAATNDISPAIPEKNLKKSMHEYVKIFENAYVIIVLLTI